MQKATASKIMGRYLTDTAFRGSINIYQGMTVNFFYVVFRVIAGIRYASVWFVSMALYYLVLGILRLYLIAEFYSSHDVNSWIADGNDLTFF